MITPDQIDISSEWFKDAVEAARKYADRKWDEGVLSVDVPTEEAPAFQLHSQVIISAALAYLANNPIVPSDLEHYQKLSPDQRSYSWEVKEIIQEFQRRMFLRAEPEVPEEVRALLINPSPDTVYGCADINRHILKAFELGKKIGGAK